MNIGNLVRRWAQWTPEKPAIIFGDRRTSYADLNERSNRLCDALLSAGLTKGDRLATLADNCDRHLEIVAAAAKGGFVVVPVNPRLMAEEVRYILHDSGARVLFLTERYRDIAASVYDGSSLHALIFIDREAGPKSYGQMLAKGRQLDCTTDVGPADPLFISYTSGTTGTPKGAVMSHRNLLANAINVAYYFEFTSSSVNLIVMPQSTGGCNHHIVAPTLFAGACFVVEDARNFDALRFFETVQRERVTHVQLVPTMIYRLLDCATVGDYDLSSLRIVGYGSAPMAIERLKEAIGKFGPKFCQVYGQTEASSLAVCLTRQDHIDAIEANDLTPFASSGRPIHGVDLRIVKDDGVDALVGEMGEVWLRGDTVTSGYWNAPEATKDAFSDGWLRTGDICRADARGFVYHVDRKKDIIISGAVNISAREIEEVIYRHPGVLECAVIAAPDSHWGESVKAVISVRPDHDVSAREIALLCEEQLPSFKRPKSIDFIEEFPKNSMGKILKRELKKRYWGDQSRLVN